MRKAYLWFNESKRLSIDSHVTNSVRFFLFKMKRDDTFQQYTVMKHEHSVHFSDV
jgi:hypothetical protein